MTTLNQEEERHSMTRVLVVDDQQLVCDGIASYYACRMEFLW